MPRPTKGVQIKLAGRPAATPEKQQQLQGQEQQGEQQQVQQGEQQQGDDEFFTGPQG